MDEKKILDMIKNPVKMSMHRKKSIQSRLNVCWKNSRWIKKPVSKICPVGGAVAAVFALVIIGGVTGLTRLSGTNGENSQNEAGTMSLADASQSTKATGETEIFEVTTENTTEATTEKTTTTRRQRMLNPVIMFLPVQRVIRRFLMP